jgi:hypothetical protein
LDVQIHFKMQRSPSKFSENASAEKNSQFSYGNLDTPIEIRDFVTARKPVKAEQETPAIMIAYRFLMLFMVVNTLYTILLIRLFSS